MMAVTSLKRIEWIDVAKGVGILAVIAGHMGYERINRIVFPWHLPLFFMIAGFFLTSQEPFNEFVRKKARVLLVPFLATALAVIIIKPLWAPFYGADMLRVLRNTVIASVYGSGGSPVLPDWVEPIGAIWFLEALFVALVIVRCLKSKWYVIVVLAFLAWYSSRYIWLPFNLQSGALASIYVYVGMRIFKDTNWLNENKFILIVLGIFAFIYAYLFDWQLFLVSNFCSAFNLIGSIFIVYSICFFSKVLLRIGLLGCVSRFYGRNSLLILCLHLFEMRCVPWYCILKHLPFCAMGGIAK